MQGSATKSIIPMPNQPLALLKFAITRTSFIPDQINAHAEEPAEINTISPLPFGVSHVMSDSQIQKSADGSLVL